MKNDNRGSILEQILYITCSLRKLFAANELKSPK